MKILFLMLDLPSDINSSNLYLDLALEFLHNQHQVYIIAPATQHQNSGIVIERGLNVLRVNTLKQQGVKSVFKKGLAQFLLPYQYRSAFNRCLIEHQFDLILMPTPPITLTNLVLYIKKRTKAKFYLILRDIYPQGAADIGLVKFRFIYNYLRRLEVKTYKNADVIGCMSQGNIDYIKHNNKYLKTEKLTLLPNWQKTANINELTINVRQKYGLKNKFIVLFGGTIGYAQKVDNIAILADHYKGNPEIVFLVIGNGVMKPYLVDLVNEMRLSNVVFMDGLPRDEYLNFVKSSDIGLITIDERFTVPTIPSKTTSYLSLGLPILAIIDKHTDYGKILEVSGAGFWSVGGDNIKLFDNFDKMYADAGLRQRMGANGLNYFQTQLTSDIAYQTIMKQIGR